MEVLTVQRARTFGGGVVLWLTLLAFGVFSPDASAQRKSTEAELKAAYIYKFALFTRWPSNAFDSAKAPFAIGVLGDDAPLADALARIAATERVGNRAIQIRRISKGEAPPECHLLFVADSERNRSQEIIALLRRKPVLTVGEVAPFCRLGGCIRFKRTGNRLDLVINPGAATEAGLRISSELLDIAEIRKTDADAEDE